MLGEKCEKLKFQKQKNFLGKGEHISTILLQEEGARSPHIENYKKLLYL